MKLQMWETKQRGMILRMAREAKKHDLIRVVWMNTEPFETIEHIIECEPINWSERALADLIRKQNTFAKCATYLQLEIVRREI